MEKPEHEYYSLESLSKESGLSFLDLFEYCRQGKLRIEINWSHARLGQFNTSCTKDQYKWIDLSISYDFPIIRAMSPCEDCTSKGNRKECKFEWTEEYLQSLQQEEIDSLEHFVRIDSNDLFVKSVEKNKFVKQIKTDSFRTELDKLAHPCPVIADMIEVWDLIVTKKHIPQSNPIYWPDGKVPRTSFKQAVRVYLHDKYDIPASERTKKGRSGYSYTSTTIKQIGEVLGSKFSGKDWRDLLAEFPVEANKQLP